MTWELWAAFVAATVVLLAVPGPTVALVVSYAVAGGRRSAWATIPGVTLGDTIALTVSLAGAGAVLAASATLFTVLKLAGAGYLIWLGWQRWRLAWRGSKAMAVAPVKPESGRRMFWNCTLVTALNPKGITFFVAFLPQFVNPAQPVLGQFVALGATFTFLAATMMLGYALLAGAVSAQRQALVRAGNWIAGGFLIGAGLMTAAVRRTS